MTNIEWKKLQVRENPSISRQEITFNPMPAELDASFLHGLYMKFREKMGADMHWMFVSKAIHKLIEEHIELLHCNSVTVVIHPNLPENQMILSIINEDEYSASTQTDYS